MPDINPWDDARQDINARLSEMWYQSPLRRGIKATTDAVGSANDAVGNYTKQLYDRLTGPPGFIGPVEHPEPSALQKLLMSLGVMSAPTASHPPPQPSKQSLIRSIK